MLVIETGRNAVKVVYEDRMFHFASVIGEARDRRKLDDEEETLSNIDIHINGQRYFVGDLAALESITRSEMLTASKIHEQTKILFATALYETNPAPKTKIITLIPINQNTPENKKELTDLLKGDYRIKRNGVARTFSVNEVLVVPEGAAAAYSEVLDGDMKMKNRYIEEAVIRVVDIGSRTVNFSTFIEFNGKKMHYRDIESGTLDYGCSTMDGVSNRDLIRKIKGDLSKYWTNMDHPTIFVGGGTLKLNQEIVGEFRQPIVHEDPLYANALGARKLGWMKYGRS